MTWYQQRPPLIEAKKWTGDNLAALQLWAGAGRITLWWEDPHVLEVKFLPTEGLTLVSLGDYVCRDDGDRLISRSAVEVEGGPGVLPKWQAIPDPVVP